MELPVCGVGGCTLAGNGASAMMLEMCNESRRLASLGRVFVRHMKCCWLVHTIKMNRKDLFCTDDREF